jgi:tRNA U34 5-methylaminomethyl-2-thiouridine-forming methyltransferase MnmC
MDISVYVDNININEVKTSLIIKSVLLREWYVATNFTMLELIPKLATEATEVEAIISDHTPSNLTPI